LLSAVPTLSWGQDLARLAVAAGLGGVIGFERELRDREAGLRTHILVALGSALFTIVSAYGFTEFLAGGVVVRTDPTRIAAQIVTGIGFLGAGAILRYGASVRGLTTAATLWVAAAIGLASGAGYYAGAVLGTAVTLTALWPLRFVAHRLIDRLRPEEQSIIVGLRRGARTAQLLDELERRDVRVDYFQLETETDRRVVTLRLSPPSETLVSHLSDLDFVQGVEWSR
jgi:putative Mg2+ transporter-C (MgtC) family protein